MREIRENLRTIKHGDFQSSKPSLTNSFRSANLNNLKHPELKTLE